MEHTRDNQQKKITASKVERDELYLYSLKKMADNNINSNESPLTGLYGIKAFFYQSNELMKKNPDKRFAVLRRMNRRLQVYMELRHSFMKLMSL